MPQTQTTARVEEEEGEPLNINPRLLAFRPRQVSLLINSTKMPSAAVKTPSVPKPNQKTLLLHSIALYLQRSGYSKTVKKLRSESDVQIDDNSEGSGFDLEDIFGKFLETSDQGSKKPETITSQEKVSAEVEKSAENGAEIKGGESGASFQFVATAEVENKKKSKKKKSKKLDVDNVESVSEDKKEVVSNMDLDNAIAEKKLKKQKKNSKKLSSTNAEEDALKVSETTVDTENQDKESKKRKRPSSQDISTPPADDEKPTEKSKRQKTEAAEKLPNTEEKPKSKSADTQTQESNGQAIEDGALASENLEKKEQKAKKSSKKQQNGPSEPTTAQRFQRVKADEVVFSDERLKDNSYWAKDGAEIGYGAKAQEVLGQVKGNFPLPSSFPTTPASFEMATDLQPSDSFFSTQQNIHCCFDDDRQPNNWSLSPGSSSSSSDSLCSVLHSTESSSSEESDDQYIAELTRQMAHSMLLDFDDESSCDVGFMDNPVQREKGEGTVKEEEEEGTKQQPPPPQQQQVRKKRAKKKGQKGPAPEVMKAVFLGVPAGRAASGTGVFLPAAAGGVDNRTTSTTATTSPELRSKSGALTGNVRYAFQLQQRTTEPSSPPPPPAKNLNHHRRRFQDMGLPQEWTY
ncbi:hypothetical protein LINGRAHAP2_LOCUS26460 [Linum grandiflorum]